MTSKKMSFGVVDVEWEIITDGRLTLTQQIR
jgi:hypothetical protein